MVYFFQYKKMKIDCFSFKYNKKRGKIKNIKKVMRIRMWENKEKKAQQKNVKDFHVSNRRKVEDLFIWIGGFLLDE